MEKKKVFVVAGPTASGKSDFAVELALIHNGEVISADSRQIYKGLDIGSGKITLEEMKGVPHHMIDILSPGEEFSVAQYQKMALPIVEDILVRGKTPIICGGTGQYIDALIFTTNLPHIPPDPRLRQELEKRSADELYEELSQKDPRRAAHIDKHNKVRLVRALEIVEKIGKVPELTEKDFRYETEFYLMHPERSVSRERTLKRLHKRLGSGMVEEGKRLLKEGVAPLWLKRLGLEYRYMTKYLLGEITYDEFVEILTHKTYQYAKRQDTWNKKYIPFAKLVEMK